MSMTQIELARLPGSASWRTPATALWVQIRLKSEEEVSRSYRKANKKSLRRVRLAAIALAIPTVFHVTAGGHAGGWSQATEHKLSLAIAVVLFVTYACLLGFELVTHKQLYVGDPQDDGKDREEAHRWSVSKSLFVLVVATSLVALMSEFLVGAVEAARASLGLTEIFVGVIVIAVIGNAAEHSTAVVMAMKNKMGLS